MAYFLEKIFSTTLLFPILKLSEKHQLYLFEEKMLLLKKFYQRFQPLITLFLKLETIDIWRISSSKK